MKVSPIPFSGPMVRAVLAGKKTQTRRILNPPPVIDSRWVGGGYIPRGSAKWSLSDAEKISPYGRRGDRLWVREAWRVPKSLDGFNAKGIAEAAAVAGWDKPWAPIRYEADGALKSSEEWRTFGSGTGEAETGRYRHGRFMPRWASRILLEVTAVRVERLLAISVDDCFAEGIELMRCPQCHLACYGLPGWGHDDVQKSPPEAYWHLWDQINEARGYGRAKNPWVWVVEFKRAWA